MAVLSSEEVEDMRPGADEGQAKSHAEEIAAYVHRDVLKAVLGQRDQAKRELFDWHQELAERMGVSEGTDPDEVLSIAEGFKQRAERLGCENSALQSTLKHHADDLAACTKALGEAQRELAEARDSHRVHHTELVDALRAAQAQVRELEAELSAARDAHRSEGQTVSTSGPRNCSCPTAGENPAAKDTDEFGLEPLAIKTGQLLSASPIRTEPTPEKAEKTRCISCARHGYGHYTTGERAACKAYNGTGEESGS